MRFILLLLFSFSALAFEVPPFTPNVVDETGTLGPGEKQEINLAIDGAQKKGVLAGVFITSRLGGEAIEDVAEQVFRKWELGEKGKDNGVLILVALADRQMRIEVGYGLEGKITDLEAQKVVEQVLKPAFRNAEYASGIILAVESMGALAAGEFPSYEVTEVSLSRKEVKERFMWWAFLFLLLPAAIQSLGLMVAWMVRAKPFELMRKKELPLLIHVLGVNSRIGIFLKVFLFVNPGVFIVLFPVFFNDQEVHLLFNVVGGLAVGIAILISCFTVLSFFSMKHLNRKMARNRLIANRSKRSPGSTYTIFGKTFSVPSRSSSYSSSSSSGSSGSSSSSGGRSGGGGASGSW